MNFEPSAEYHEVVHFHPETDEEVTTYYHTEDAPSEGVHFVLNQPIDDDGRSQWLWIRLPDGTLILGVYPCGETYFGTEGYRSI